MVPLHHLKSLHSSQASEDCHLVAPSFDFRVSFSFSQVFPPPSTPSFIHTPFLLLSHIFLCIRQSQDKRVLALARYEERLQVLWNSDFPLHGILHEAFIGMSIDQSCLNMKDQTYKDCLESSKTSNGPLNIPISLLLRLGFCN